MVTGFAAGISAGAAYSADSAPFGTIVPTVEFPPAIPFTSHAMVAPGARQNDAVKVFVCPSAMLALEGEIEFVAVQAIVTLELPDFEVSDTLVAVTSTAAGEGTVAGAVYSAESAPFGTIVPTVEFPPAIPFTPHVTPVAGLPVAEMPAVKICAPPVGTVTAFGVTPTTMLS
jgi:hypothetical protein